MLESLFIEFAKDRGVNKLFLTSLLQYKSYILKYIYTKHFCGKYYCSKKNEIREQIFISVLFEVIKKLVVHDILL